MIFKLDKYLFSVVWFVLFVFGSDSVNSEQTAVSSLTNSSKVISDRTEIVASIFNSLKPIDIEEMEIEDFSKGWYQANISRGSGMFNPVFIPFIYKSQSSNSDFNQPLTFPSLLSFKFDFVPDNFSARHPAFIYRKKPVWYVKPNESAKIVEYINYWEATHAIGGTLIEGDNGYRGSLLVFDNKGKRILKKKFDEQLPYFTLMGKMVKAWMDYRKQEVSEGLLRELYRPMTKNSECIRLYGTSFTVAWRTDKEWAIYDNILELDPDFGEVRFWYSNQKNWTLDDGDLEKKQLMIEKGKALKSHLVIPALNEFDFKNCSDKKLVGDCLKVLEYAEKICGENSTIMSVKLEVTGNKMSIQQLDDLLTIAEKYPCSWNFIKDLAWEYRQRGIYEKSIPLLLSAVNSGYMKGVGRFDWEWYLLQKDFLSLGFIDESINCGLRAVQDCSDSRKPYVYWYLALAFRERNQHKAAKTCFQFRENMKKDSWGDLYSVLTEYEEGVVKPQSPDENTSRNKYFNVLKRARYLAANDSFEQALGELNLKVFTRNDSNIPLEKEIIRSDIYYMQGEYQKAFEHACKAWFLSPRNRKVAYLLDHSSDNHKIIIARYAKVGLFICEKDPCWLPIFEKYKDSLTDERRKSIVLLRDTQKKIMANSGMKPLGVMSEFKPFEVEYASICVFSNLDLTYRQKCLGMYLDYKRLVDPVSEWQKCHTRQFFIKLLHLLPEKDRQIWMIRLNEKVPE